MDVPATTRDVADELGVAHGGGKLGRSVGHVVAFVSANVWGAGIRPFRPTVRRVVAVVVAIGHASRGGVGGDGRSATVIVAIAVSGGCLRHLGEGSQELVAREASGGVDGGTDSTGEGRKLGGRDVVASSTGEEGGLGLHLDGRDVDA